MKQGTKILAKGGLFFFLIGANLVAVFADPARVISKRENMPDDGGTKTRIFLDITPDDGNDRADAYTDLLSTDMIMSMQEFGEMIQVGDIIEYRPLEHPIKDGRFTVIRDIALIEHNGRNIYQLFREELGDRSKANIFWQSKKAFEAAQAGAGKNQQSMLYKKGKSSKPSLARLVTPKNPSPVPMTKEEIKRDLLIKRWLKIATTDEDILLTAILKPNKQRTT